MMITDAVNATAHTGHDCPDPGTIGFGLSDVELVAEVVYAVLFVVGTLGNAFVVVMILHVVYTQYTSTARVVRMGGPLNSSYHMIIYVLALSLVDFCVCLHLPILVHNIHTGSFAFGRLGCRVYMVFENLPKSASTYLLALMSGERYMVVCRPATALKRVTLGRQHTRAGC